MRSMRVGATGLIVCDCHPETPELREAIRATEGEENTVDDWRDLHDMIEGYRRRRAARHVLAHLREQAVSKDSGGVLSSAGS